jgi:hypothetical protein
MGTSLSLASLNAHERSSITSVTYLLIPPTTRITVPFRYLPDPITDQENQE